MGISQSSSPGSSRDCYLLNDFHGKELNQKLDFRSTTHYANPIRPCHTPTRPGEKIECGWTLAEHIL